MFIQFVDGWDGRSWAGNVNSERERVHVVPPYIQGIHHKEGPMQRFPANIHKAVVRGFCTLVAMATTPDKQVSKQFYCFWAKRNPCLLGELDKGRELRLSPHAPAPVTPVQWRAVNGMIRV